MTTKRSGQYLDHAAEMDAWIGPGYPETFPASVTVGTRVYGALGTDAEVGSWGAGVIAEINEARSEAVVLFSNKQQRLMSASECIIEGDRR